MSTIPVEKSGIWYIENASILTYPMSTTVYTLTPEKLEYEVIRLKATPEESLAYLSPLKPTPLST